MSVLKPSIHPRVSAPIAILLNLLTSERKPGSSPRSCAPLSFRRRVPPTLTFAQGRRVTDADERDWPADEPSGSACLRRAQLCLGFIRALEAYRTHQLCQPSITAAAAAEGAGMAGGGVGGGSVLA